MPVTSNLEMFTSLAPLLSPVLVILGWIIVNAQNNGRETRKEIRATLESTYKLLDELEAEAIKFHTSEIFDNSQAHTLTLKIQRVIEKIRLLSQILDCNLNTECKNLRQAITRDNFDKTNHKAIDYNDNLILNITDCNYCIRQDLETEFHKRFLISKPQKFLRLIKSFITQP